MNTFTHFRVALNLATCFFVNPSASAAENLPKRKPIVLPKIEQTEVVRNPLLETATEHFARTHFLWSPEMIKVASRFLENSNFQKLEKADQNIILSFLPYSNNTDTLFNLCTTLIHGIPEIAVREDAIPSILDSFRLILESKEQYFSSQMPEKIVDQLVFEYANWRKLVDQADLPACNPIALYISLLRTKPAAAMDIVAQLITHGEFTRGTFYLAPQFDIATLDYIVPFALDNPSTIGERLMSCAMLYNQQKRHSNIAYSPYRDGFAPTDAIQSQVTPSSGMSNQELLQLLNSFGFKRTGTNSFKELVFSAIEGEELDQLRYFAEKNPAVVEKFFRELFSEYGNLPIILTVNCDPLTGMVHDGSTHALAVVGVSRDGIQIINPNTTKADREVTIPFTEAMHSIVAVISPATLSELCPEVTRPLWIDRMRYFGFGGLVVGMIIASQILLKKKWRSSLQVSTPAKLRARWAKAEGLQQEES